MSEMHATPDFVTNAENAHSAKSEAADDAYAARVRYLKEEITEALTEGDVRRKLSYGGSASDVVFDLLSESLGLSFFDDMLTLTSAASSGKREAMVSAADNLIERIACHYVITYADES